MTVKPVFCSLNVRNGQNRNLSSEPGIPELKQLYYDEYNYETGKYSTMSDTMKKAYQTDVRRLYKAFTGEADVPAGIHSFSDIKLKDFHNSKGCKTGGMYTRGYEGSVKDKLFAQYVDHVKAMMKKAETNQNKLLAIIDMLFAFTVNPQTLNKEITISPSLTDASLQSAVEKTRAIILDLYLSCEKDFVTGLQIFEAIVEKQIMETSAEQVKNLRTQSERVMADAARISEEADVPRRVGFADQPEVQELPPPAPPSSEVVDEHAGQEVVIPPGARDIVIDVEGDQQRQLRAVGAGGGSRHRRGRKNGAKKTRRRQ